MSRNEQDDIDDNDDDDDYNISSEGVGSNRKKTSHTKSKWEKTKKKYILEDNDHINDNNSIDNQENVDNSEIFVEKSPKGRFGRFNEELGSGAIKRVYKGYDFNEGRDIAWNQINVQNMAEKELEKITDEVNLLKKLNHPNIINYISGWFDEDKKEIVIITEIFTGGSLRRHLHKLKHPRLKLIKYWIKEILKGLIYLHNHDPPIIHRDIKCDNIFINSQDGTIKIGDLGFSCMMKESYAKSFLGTPEFMAPEVYKGKYGLKADIYSLGMCVLEMVTLEKPYKECDNIYGIFENSEKGILPKALYKIQDEKMFAFISSCLKPENERKRGEELLESEYLNDLEGEENSNPVRLIELIHSIPGIPQISTNNADSSKTKRYKKEENCPKKSLYTSTNNHSNGELHLQNSNFNINKQNNYSNLAQTQLSISSTPKDTAIQNQNIENIPKNIENCHSHANEKNENVFKYSNHYSHSTFNLQQTPQSVITSKKISNGKSVSQNINNEVSANDISRNFSNFYSKSNIGSECVNFQNLNCNNTITSFTNFDNSFLLSGLSESTKSPDNFSKTAIKNQLIGYNDNINKNLYMEKNKNSPKIQENKIPSSSNKTIKQVNQTNLTIEEQNRKIKHYQQNCGTPSLKEIHISENSANTKINNIDEKTIKQNSCNNSKMGNQFNYSTKKLDINDLIAQGIKTKKDSDIKESNLTNIRLIQTKIPNISIMNKPIINHINNISNMSNVNNSTTMNSNILKKENHSNISTKFDQKRYNLKKFQTSNEANILKFTQGIKHSVSLKQFLNNNNSSNRNNTSFSKFQINIISNTQDENEKCYESNEIVKITETKNPGDNIKDQSDLHLNKILDNTDINSTRDPNMIKITFVVKKDEWKKKKQIIFDYNIKTDTIEGVVKELQTELGLTEEENKIVLEKLDNFISKYNHEGFGSTTPELDNYNKQKKDLEEISIKMNKMIGKIKNFITENDEILTSLNNEKNYIENSLKSPKNEIDYQKINCLKIKKEINDKTMIFKEFLEKINNSSKDKNI